MPHTILISLSQVSLSRLAFTEEIYNMNRAIRIFQSLEMPVECWLGSFLAPSERDILLARKETRLLFPKDWY
jgi:hypothetical protein